MPHTQAAERAFDHRLRPARLRRITAPRQTATELAATARDCRRPGEPAAH
ncbi:hypothetical protein PV726_25865 [Streptomyces europaeiscabiei]|nr:hypothetical protein [Streptomyces europaeiscabiei]MDX3693709.1 hypothetical protein [Streptomyces europaeiscabiei]